MLLRERANRREVRGARHSRHDRHARLDHPGPGPRLGPHRGDRLRGRADERQARVAAGAREDRVLGEKTVSGMEQAGARPGGRLEQPFDGKVGLPRAERARAGTLRPRTRRAPRRGPRRSRRRPNGCPSPGRPERSGPRSRPGSRRGAFSQGPLHRGDLTEGCCRASSGGIVSRFVAANANAWISFRRVSDGSMISST